MKLPEGRDLISKPGWNLGFSRKITENLTGAAGTPWCSRLAHGCRRAEISAPQLSCNLQGAKDRPWFSPTRDGLASNWMAFLMGKLMINHWDCGVCQFSMTHFSTFLWVDVINHLIFIMSLYPIVQDDPDGCQHRRNPSGAWRIWWFQQPGQHRGRLGRKFWVVNDDQSWKDFGTH